MVLFNPSEILRSLKNKVIKFYYGRYNYIYYLMAFMIDKKIS